MAKGWTEERRKAQAERCRKNAPWKKATGPKTAAGKAKSSVNAYKHGGYRRVKSLAEKAFFHNAATIEAVLALHEIELTKDEQKQYLILKNLNKIRQTD